MATSQVQVGNQFVSDGGLANQRGDSYGSTMLQQFNGRYAELVRRGQMFMYNLPAAGQAFLLSATTGLVPTIWNPLGSGKIFYPLVLSVQWLSTAATPGALVWSITKNAGNQIATAAAGPILTFTAVAPENALGGGGTTSSMLWSPTTNTFTAAPAFWASTGLNILAGPGGPHTVDLNGANAILPGQALSLTYSVTTSTGLFQATIWGAELPLA